MGVDDPESLVLLLEIDDQPGEDGVFQHIGEIACMVDMAIIHEFR
jgi:hypothetical protein